jgi:hypothetical protein
MTSPDLIGPIMAAILDCASQALADNDRPCDRVLLAPGAEVAWDECCDGFLYVRLISMFGSGNPFPNQDTRPGGCKPTMIASTLGIGVGRCASTQDDDGIAPPVDTLTAEALGVVADASIILDAIKCCVAPLTDDPDSNVLATSLGAWSPSGPQGGCVGGEWSLVVGHGACPCGD